MSASGQLSGDRIRELIVEVAELLVPTRAQATIVLVGGSLLAWRGLRLATEDVDSSVRIDAELRAAVHLVAERNGLAVDWLNDHAASWHPETLRLEDCDVLLHHPRLRVLGAPLPAVFLMKLNRSQPQDVTDMLTLWPLVAPEFPAARDVSAAFYAAFPLEEPDEYLEAQVVDLARRVGMTLPFG